MSNSIELECEATVKKVSVTAKLEKSQVIRKMRIALERQFDPLMASAIGGDAAAFLKGLKSHGAEKVVMPIDSVYARLDLHVASVGSAKDDSVVIPKCVGLRATASAAAMTSEDDLDPTIVLEFEFIFSEAAWAWFGRNCGGFATVQIKPAQMKLQKVA